MKIIPGHSARRRSDRRPGDSISSTRYAQPAQAQRAQRSVHQLMHHSNNQANSSVFRLDVNSGRRDLLLHHAGYTADLRG